MKLFELLTKEEKKQCKLVNIKKDQILFHEDEECLSIGIVEKGSIEIVSYTLSGQEIVYNKINEGEMFGNNLIFSDYPYYKGNVISKRDGKVLLINKASLLKILQNNSDFLVAYLSYQANFSKELNGKIKLLSLSSAEERLLYFLKEKKRVAIHSVTDLAKQLYLSREALSRLLTKMQKEGKIIKEGNVLQVKH